MYLLRYDELALKSRPVRGRWEKKLVREIKRAVKGAKVKREWGRIWVEAHGAEEKLKKIFGIHSFSPCEHFKLEELEEASLKFAEQRLKDKKTFALQVNRVGEHEFTSQDIAKKLGAGILQRLPHLKVDLKNPEKEIFIEIRGNDCYLFDEVIPGSGGLPLGVEGKVVALISGGIDSPVAAWMMMKRGCEVVPLYLDNRPFADDATLERAILVTDVLKEYQPNIELNVVQHGDFLVKAKKFLKQKGAENYTCVICRREMYRKAEQLARKVEAKAIVTGESLGQVASQTLDNLHAIDSAANIPIFRPLIGFDKLESINLARKIGTFETSIMPVMGCGASAGRGCGAAPRKPATKARLEKVLELEKACLGQS